MITCPFCNTIANHHKRGVNRKNLQRYSCRNCGREFTSQTTVKAPQPVVVIECVNCGRETINPKFCSRTCAVAYNNRVAPKRKPAEAKRCKVCGTGIRGRRMVCDECNTNIVDWSKRTMKEMREAPSYQVNARIRSLARKLYRNSDCPKYCICCGYAKYYEVCHVIAISDFPDTALVSEVNSLDNLMALCPNCHWEFDHGLLKVVEGVFYPMLVARPFEGLAG